MPVPWSRPRLLALLALTGAGATACGADLILPADPARLVVAGSGSGSGTVATTVAPAPALNCTITSGAADADSCSVLYAVGTSVTLAADPAEGSRFTGWSGACSGTAACSLSLGDSARVVAAFEESRFSLLVVGAGTGSGAVRSAAGLFPVIDCTITEGLTGDSGCNASFLLSGNQLTLSATPDGRNTFAGWGGDCSGTSDCSLVLDRDHVVSAAFVHRR